MFSTCDRSLLPNMADNVVQTDGLSRKTLSCLVADSAAFIRNVDLQTLSDNIFTIPDVINEIRDPITKQRLAVLPYEVLFREPSLESLNFVTQFSKKTGDYKSLSAVDLRVLALVYQLEKEFCSPNHVKQEPSKKTEIVTKRMVRSDKEMAGFFFEPKNKNSVDVDNEQVLVSMEIDENKNKMEEKHGQENCETDQVDTISTEDENNIDVEEDDGEDDQKDDSEGWITPKNITKVKQKMGLNDEIEIKEGEVNCACLTTDFAMQNVLIQMGLHVVSVHGRLIKQARNYIQKCFGCYKETHDMERLFCPGCGNKTLTKLSVTISDDGTIQYHYPKRLRQHNTRGTKFSIPTPKGGRHCEQILLAEDQPTRQNRLPRNKDNLNPLDPDYVSRTNPFTVNDVNSRAFNLGLHVKQRQNSNPNQSRKKQTGRRR